MSKKQFLLGALFLVLAVLFSEAVMAQPPGGPPVGGGEPGAGLLLYSY